jgi:hypothetical protein
LPLSMALPQTGRSRWSAEQLTLAYSRTRPIPAGDEWLLQRAPAGARGISGRRRFGYSSSNLNRRACYGRLRLKVGTRACSVLGMTRQRTGLRMQVPIEAVAPWMAPRH